MLATAVVALAGFCLLTVQSSPVRPIPNFDVDDVRPNRPGLVACQPESACFRTCDLPFKTCLISANTDPEAIEGCYHDHSDCLADTCKCSDADDGAGYPVMSQVDTCFILCRTDVLECLTGESRCESTYPQCMEGCLPDTPNLSIRDNMAAKKWFYFYAQVDFQGLASTIKLENDVCADTTSYDQQIFVSASMATTDYCDHYQQKGCRGDHVTCNGPCNLASYANKVQSIVCRWSEYDHPEPEFPWRRTIAEEVRAPPIEDRGKDDKKDLISLPDATPSMLLSNHPTTNVAPRPYEAERSVLDARADFPVRKHFWFYKEKDARGLAQVVRFRNNKCMSTLMFDSETWVSAKMAPTDHCMFFSTSDCTGEAGGCDGPCNLGRQVRSAFCWWFAFKSKRELSTEDHSNLESRAPTTKDVTSPSISHGSQVATRTMVFYPGYGGNGAPQKWVVVEYKKCLNIDVSLQFHSLQLEPDENCGLYSAADCRGAPSMCYGGQRGCSWNYGIPPMGASVKSISCEFSAALARSGAISPRQEDVAIASRSIDYEGQLDGQVPTRTISFFWNLVMAGRQDLIVVEDQKCQTLHRGQDWRLLRLDGVDENCDLYSGSKCEGSTLIQHCRGQVGGCGWDYKGSETLESIYCTFNTKIADPGRLISRSQDIGELNERSIEQTSQAELRGPDRTIAFYWESSGVGRSDWLVVSNGKCQQFSRGKDLHAMKLDGADEYCVIYSGSACESNKVIKACNGQDGGCAWSYTGTQTLESVFCAFNTALADPGRKVLRARETKQLASRQGLVTKTFEFHTDFNLRGNTVRVLLAKGFCTNLASYDPASFRSLNLRPGETCRLFTATNCGSGYETCTGGPCNFNRGAQKVAAARCDWLGGSQLAARTIPSGDKRQAQESPALNRTVNTRNIAFNTRSDGLGTVVWITVTNNVCRNLGAQHNPAALRVMILKTDESCAIYSKVDCAGDGNVCKGTACNISQVDSALVAVKCAW